MTLKHVVYGGMILGSIGIGIVGSEYQDVFGFLDKLQAGRTKNSIASVVSGLVSQRLDDGNNDINMNVGKVFFPDSKITGFTTRDTIHTDMGLWFTSNKFDAGRKNGLMNGRVDKSEFDWKVKEKPNGDYDVARFGPKFDASVEDLKVKDGVISGTYSRPGPNFDWDIDGTYDSDGNVQFTIDGPFNLGISLEGTIK